MPLLNTQGLLTNPLAMAGLGLLSQPTQSRYPINPMAAVMGGMQMAGRNQYDQQMVAGQQAEMQMRAQQMQFEMEEALRQREQEAVARAEQERQRKAQEDYMVGRPPEEQVLARAMGLPAYMEAMGKRQFAEPAGPESREGKLAADLMRANPGLSLPEAMAQAGSMLNQRAAASAQSLTVKQFPAPPTGYYYIDPENPASGLAPLGGGPADPNKKDLNESQGNATMFYNRASEMDKSLSSSAYDPTGVQAAFDRMATGPALTNWMASDQGQAYINQGKNFVAAVLRKESGAAITNEEWATGQQLYVDMPGDSAELRAQKAQNRKLAIDGLKVAAGPGIGRLSGNPAMGGAEIVPNQNANDPDPLGLRR